MSHIFGEKLVSKRSLRSRKTSLAFLFAILLGVQSDLQAQMGIHAGPQISLLGFGLSGELNLGRFGVSGEFGFVPVRSIAFTEEDIDFLVNTDFYGGLFMLNLRPTAGKLSLDFGILYGGYLADGSASNVDRNVFIGNHLYDAADLGDLLADIDFDGPAPATMIGLRGRGFNLGIGLAITGEAQVNLAATGLIKDDPQFVEDLALQASNIERDILSKIPFMPLFRIGWQY